MSITISTLPAPWGYITAAERDGCVIGVWFDDGSGAKREYPVAGRDRMYADIADGLPDCPPLKSAGQLHEYLAGKRRRFDLTLAINGTAFQRAVWQACGSIPYGATATYAETAAAAGSPKAFRAVGGALAANRLPVIIPCHRVVAKAGLGGFSGGYEMGDVKEKLLEMENLVKK